MALKNIDHIDTELNYVVHKIMPITIAILKPFKAEAVINNKTTVLVMGLRNND